MKDIKELALQEAKNLLGEPLNIEQAEHYETFATRLIAAYLAEQEPVAIIGMDYTGAYILHGAPNNLQQGTKLFTAPLEPAPKETALSMYKRFEVEYETADPVERLRAFCSFALDGQDWLDVEPFFDALTERLAARVPDGCVVVPREATDEMLLAAESVKQYELSTPRLRWEAMIAAWEVKP